MEFDVTTLKIGDESIFIPTADTEKNVAPFSFKDQELSILRKTWMK